MARVGLSFSDRSEISAASKAGWSVRRIARHLGRCPSVISRELHRNSTKTRGYQAVTADVRARVGELARASRKVAGIRCRRRGWTPTWPRPGRRTR